VKKNIILQFIIILIILIFWNSIHFGYNFQKQNYFDEISEIPILLFSQKTETLDSLKTQLSSTNYISQVEIETKTKIAEKLISQYELDSVESVLKNHSLPDVMKIFPNGIYFNRENKDKLLHIISGANMEMEFNPELWEIVHKKIELIEKSYKYINVLIIIFILFITVFLRLHFEFGADKFWSVYRSSGGKFGKRRKYFIINSLMLIILPVLLIYLCYTLLLKYSVFLIKIEPLYFGLEIIVLIISSLISALILGKRLL